MFTVVGAVSVTDVLGWIVAGFFLLLIGLWVLFVAVLLIASRFEKIRFKDCTRDVPPDEAPVARPRAVGEAMDAGLELVRTIRSTESNLISGYEWLLASPDRRILCTISKSRFGSTFSFISRRSDGVWLLTKQSVGTPLRAGRRVILDDLQTSRLLDTLNLHRIRLRDVADQVQTLDPMKNEDWGCNRAVYEDMIDAGMAKWVDASQTAASLTLRGSAHLALNGVMLLRAAKRHQARAAEVARDAASLPPLGLDATSAPTLPAAAILPILPPTVPAPLPIRQSQPQPMQVDYVVISRRIPSGVVDYLPYTVDGQSYLPVFKEETQAVAYSALYPPPPGETHTPTHVSADWLRQCIDMGYILTLDPHLPTRSAITRTQI